MHDNYVSIFERIFLYRFLFALFTKHFTLPHTGRALTNEMLWHLLPVRHHHRHQSPAKKLTHPKFSGGYLLLHYPSTQSNYLLDNNQIDESYDDNMMSNDITERKSDISMKNKYTMRFRRNVDPVMIEYCCNPGNACGQHFCHRWQRFWSLSEPSSRFSSSSLSYRRTSFRINFI